MSLKEKLAIVLITYNRKELLNKTLEQIFDNNSPIKDVELTIIDNNSNDGTFELIGGYVKKYTNITYIKNPRNIGGCANIVKAFAEFLNKDYIWLLGDNDGFDWEKWGEIELAIQQGYDAIITQKCEPNKIFLSASLISGAIYKTSNITTTVIENMFDYIHILFPHLAIISKIINDNKKIYTVTKSIIKMGKNPNQRSSYTRGFDLNDLSDARKCIFGQAGYIATTELIKDKKQRAKIIDAAGYEHKNCFELFKTIIVHNKIYYNNFLHNLLIVFKVLNLKQKFEFIKAFLDVNLSMKDFSFYEVDNKEDWMKYLSKVNEQKYIDKLARKLKGKKVLFYGAGMTAEIILKNYDLSELNISGISDRRFTIESIDFCGIKTIPVNKLAEEDFDAVIFTMKLYENIAKSLQKSGIQKPMFSIIKKSKKYPMRF